LKLVPQIRTSPAYEKPKTPIYLSIFSDTGKQSILLKNLLPYLYKKAKAE
jgi:hypothetical protein